MTGFDTAPTTVSADPGAGHRAERGGPAAIDTPVPGVRVLHAADPLDRESSARLLRLVDTQLMLARSGHLRLRAVIVDLSAVHRAEREGPAALTHARYACGRMGVAFALAGMPGALYATPVAVRTRLRGFTAFPTVGLAVDALTDRNSARRDDGSLRR